MDEERGVPAYLAEFLGTLLLVMFIGFVVTLNSGSGLGYTDFAVVGLLHFFVLAVLIVTLGGTSGAHFNPAVTVTLTALRKIKPSDAVIYILAQVAGAIVGAVIVKLILKNEGEVGSYGGVGFENKFIDGAVFPALVVEAIGTFILMWAIMGTAVSPKTPVSWAPLAIGGALALAVVALAPLTGAGFNPARAFGPDLIGSTLGDVGVGNFLLAYVLGPIVGALAAGFAYMGIVIHGGPTEAPIEKLP
jgi:glycerol uptake facilitator protein